MDRVWILLAFSPNIACDEDASDLKAALWDLHNLAPFDGIDVFLLDSEDEVNEKIDAIKKSSPNKYKFMYEEYVADA